MSHVYRERREVEIPFPEAHINHSDGRVFLLNVDGPGKELPSAGLQVKRRCIQMTNSAEGILNDGIWNIPNTKTPKDMKSTLECMAFVLAQLINPGFIRYFAKPTIPNMPI